MAKLRRLRALRRRREYLVLFIMCPYCLKQYMTERDAKNCRQRCARKRWRSLKKESVK